MLLGPSAAERRRALFYAEASAGFYDVSIEDVVPYYSHLHDTTLHLLAHHLGGADAYVLDVGSGTGAEALRVLTALPHTRIVAVDLCAPMHELFRGKARRERLLRRCRFVLGDFVADECGPDRLRAQLPRGRRRTGYDAVLSAFTLHHLEHAEKIAAFARVHALLRPGGVFLNADLFSFSSPDLSRQALEFDLSWIRERLGRSRAFPPAHRRQLVRQWIEHYQRYNRLEPIEDCASGEPGQAEMLVAAGFCRVSVPYRFWQTGIVLAVK